MKIKYLLLSIIGLSFFLGSCYDEDKAEPSGDYSPVRFEFPQGNESWDKFFEKMYNDYGLCVIYKGFDANDLNKNWTMSGGGSWIGHPPVDEHMPKYQDLLENYLVPFLGKKEVVEASAPLYLYLAEDLGTSEFMVSYTMGGINLGGLDFWAIGLNDTIDAILPYPGIEDFRKGLVTYVYNQIVENAVLRGIIPEPSDFRAGIDYKTEVETENPDDPNYYAARGLVGYLTYTSWNSNLGCMFNWYDSSFGIADIVTAKGGDFMMSTRAVMRWSKEEFEEKFPPETYPLVNKRYNMVVEQFKKYGFDLQGFTKKAKELPTPW